MKAGPFVCALVGHRWGQFENLLLALHQRAETGTLAQQIEAKRALAHLEPRTGGSRTMPLRLCERCPTYQTWDEAYAVYDRPPSPSLRLIRALGFEPPLLAFARWIDRQLRRSPSLYARLSR